MTIMGKVQGTGKKHLSKSQKKRLKLSKTGKKEFKPTGKRGRLIVRNLPFKCNENELHKHFSPFGEVIDIHLLRRPDNKLVGCGFVEYSSRLSADKAKEELSGKQFLGRPIYIDRAVSREHYDEPPKEEEKKKSDEVCDDDNIKNEWDESEVKEEPASDEDCHIDTPEIKQEELSSEEDSETESNNENLHNANKDEKNSKNFRKGRLIVRNLSFKATEEKLKAHFSQFGEIMEVKLLRRPDNTLVGCGFVQFTKKLAAAKAIHHTSGKPFLDRPIIVDWAIAKDRFKKMQEEAVKQEIKREDGSDEETKPLDASDVSVKKEESEDDSDDESDNESESSDSEEKEEDERDDDEDESDEVEDFKSDIKEEGEEGKRQRKEDVDEGKTVFVKNLPFSVTDAEFRDCMVQYGPVCYALVCKDKLTEHSKGSGFVKFKTKENAEKCLSAGTELTLKGTILDPHPALKRNDAQKLKDKAKEKKDNRNLYLVKEGMIIAGTPATQGVSVADMEHRLQLEQWKTTKLRNLNMFVSRNRLVIHNLPVTLNDKQLRKLFQYHTGPRAVIKEARVMRDLKKVDAKGMGVSKGYGFVSFEKHEDALKALRCINNNPDVFSATSRPIVAFSIENLTILNAKTKRMIRSREKNPLCKDYKPEEEEEVPAKKAKRGCTVMKHEEHNDPQYAGIAAKPGATIKMRQKYKLKNQAQQHMQDVKKQKHELKMTRKMRRTEHIKKKKVEKKSSKQTRKIVDNDAAFSKLVDKYKTKIMSQTSEKKKWYDDG